MLSSPTQYGGSVRALQDRATVLHKITATARKASCTSLTRRPAGRSMVFCVTCLQFRCPGQTTYRQARKLCAGSYAENHKALHAGGLRAAPGNKRQEITCPPIRSQDGQVFPLKGAPQILCMSPRPHVVDFMSGLDTPTPLAQATGLTQFLAPAPEYSTPLLF